MNTAEVPRNVNEVHLLRVLPAALAALLLGTSALAEEAPPEPEKSEGVEDIYVTAERRESRLQDTPVAVSVFTGNELDKQGYLDFEDLSLNIPNIQFGRTLVGSGGVTIRGVSSSAGDRATAFHVDGIYINHSGAAEGLTFFDVERVEVLRGPQGTLYGRNATGGSINVITKRPGPDLEAFGDIQFGSYNQILWRGALNVPIVEDRLFARVSLFGEQRDGFQKNITTKQTIKWDGSPTSRKDADDADEFAVRSQLRWLPTDNLDLTLRYNYSQQRGVGGAQKVLGDFPERVDFDVDIPDLGLALTLPIDQYCTSADAMASGCEVTPNPSGKRKIALDLIGKVDSWDHTINGQVLWDLPELSWAGETQFQGLFSHLERRSFTQSDQDGSDGDLIRFYTTNERIPPTIFDFGSGCDPEAFGLGATPEDAGCVPGHDELTETTFEVQWRSAGAEALDWVIGAFYLHSKSDANFLAATHPAPWIDTLGIGDDAAFLQVPVLTSEVNKATSIAAFGQADYHFGEDSDTIWDDWTATFGLRYSYDEKKKTSKTPEVVLPIELLGFEVVVPVQAEIDVKHSENWKAPSDALTGTVRAKWDWSESNHAYFSVARGYKSGFINAALVDPTDEDSLFENADPEHIWAFEFGSKNRFWEDRIQANFTAFYYLYKNLQVTQLANAAPITENASDATLWGIEVELLAKPLEGFVPELFEGFQLAANFGFLDATYDDFGPPTLDELGRQIGGCYLGEGNSRIDCSDNTLVRAPPYTITVIASWPFDFGRFGTLAPSAQFYASGKVYFRPSNCPSADCQTAIDDEFGIGVREQNDDFQDAYHITDARLTWTSADRFLSVSAFVDNIFNKDVIQSQVVGSFLIGAPIQVRFDRPRTWGVRLGLAW